MKESDSFRAASGRTLLIKDLVLVVVGQGQDKAVGCHIRRGDHEVAVSGKVG